MTESSPAPFLDVVRSFNGRLWRLRPGCAQTARAIAQRFGLPEIVCRILAARGVSTETAALFLSPTLREQMPDPSRLKDMDAAATRLAEAVVARETIAVFGDYDVDGATSSALLIRFFRAVGLEPLLYIPDRLREGYGPNAAAFSRLKEAGTSLIVTVDCGVSAFDALSFAADIGLEVIVVDHHNADPELPPACAIVNPKRLDDSSPHKTLAAVGVAFLLIVAVNRTLRTRGWYAAMGTPEPDLMVWLDLVALGTVCDVVPLIDLNRALVVQGLKVLARRGNPGLKALCDQTGGEQIDAYRLGYVFGPRINAGGRVGQADLGARLLVCEDPAEAAVLALRLEEFNADRQAIEAAVLSEAIEQAEQSRMKRDAALILASHSSWHQGVVGIVAGRLKERYGVPCCVVAVNGETAKGSGRSVPGLDLGRAVAAARKAGLLEAGGGHAMAAGFSLQTDRLDAFRAFLDAHLQAQRAAGESTTPTLDVDGALDIGALTPELLEALSRCSPFGAGNEEPRFAVPSVRVAWSDVVGQGHVRASLCGPGGQTLKAIAFKSADSALGAALLDRSGAAVHVAGMLRFNVWQGRRTIQLVVEDAAPA